MPPAYPDVDFVFAKIRNKRKQLSGVVVHGLTRQEPANVSPKAAILRRMRISLFVGILMHAMDGDPKNGATLQSFICRWPYAGYVAARAEFAPSGRASILPRAIRRRCDGGNENSTGG